MKRLFSILLLSGMLMTPALSYSNQYKDFAIGAIKGVNTVALVTFALNLASDIVLAYNNRALAQWIPDPIYLAGIIGSMVIGTTPKNDAEKDGHLMGSVASIAGMVVWNLYKK